MVLVLHARFFVPGSPLLCCMHVHLSSRDLRMLWYFVPGGGPARNALSNITNKRDLGVIGPVRATSKRKMVSTDSKQHQHQQQQCRHDAVTTYSRRDHAQHEEVQQPPIQPSYAAPQPPAVPGRSPKRFVCDLQDTPSELCEDPWLGSIFNSINSVSSSSGGSICGLDSHRGAKLEVTSDTLTSYQDEAEIQSSPARGAYASKDASPEGYGEYTTTVQEGGGHPEQSWWECDFCGLAFANFDDASSHEEGCTLNIKHASLSPRRTALSPICEAINSSLDHTPSSDNSRASPFAQGETSGPRTLFRSPQNPSLVQGGHVLPYPLAPSALQRHHSPQQHHGHGRPPPPSPDTSSSPGFELTATICYAGSPDEATSSTLPKNSSPPPLHSDVRRVAASPSPQSSSSSESSSLAPPHLRALMSTTEMMHIESLQQSLMAANQALLEMNDKMQMQSRQETIVLERVQVSDRLNAQLKAQLAAKEEELEAARKAVSWLL